MSTNQQQINELIGRRAKLQEFCDEQQWKNCSAVEALINDLDERIARLLYGPADMTENHWSRSNV